MDFEFVRNVLPMYESAALLTIRIAAIGCVASFAVGFLCAALRHLSVPILRQIAPAVQKGNSALLSWLNDEITALGNESFFHADYAATLADVYGTAIDPGELVVEGGVVE